MATTELAVRRNGPAELSFPELMSLADSLARSNFFGVKDGAQALAKILAGREMGFEPVASLMGIHLIEGKPTIGAGLMASAVKRSGRYDYRVNWSGPNEADIGCTLFFTRGAEELGTSTFTTKDAREAGLAGKSVWKSYPRNMCFARALSNGVRWYCPDIFQGAVYTPEELGQEVDDEGNAVNVVVPQAVVTVQPSNGQAKARQAPGYVEAFPAAGAPSADYLKEFEADPLAAIEESEVIPPFDPKGDPRAQFNRLAAQADDLGIEYLKPTTLREVPRAFGVLRQLVIGEQAARAQQGQLVEQESTY